MSYKQMTGNIISATKVEPVGTSEVGAASGVWNLDDVYDYKRGANWPEAGVADPSTFIENNFSTFLYTGDGVDDRAINTNIDLANKEGLVWTKERGAVGDHALHDTVRGATKRVESNTTAAEQTTAAALKSFTSTGFTVGDSGIVNQDARTYCAWTFKKAPKFFDIVTYEGTGSARTVAHSLGGTVGMILIKNRDATDNWAVYHRANTAAPQTDYLILNTKAGTVDSAAWWNDTAPTTSVFTVGTDHAVNADGENYVAYVFAHETGDDSMIQCGSYTGNANATGPSIALGWEPQWVMIKHATAGVDNHWYVVDSMRGMTIESNAVGLLANANNAELTNFGEVQPVATGFKIAGTTGTGLNANGSNYVYMAIRRPNMATITDATEVFAVAPRTNTIPGFASGFPVDFLMGPRNLSGDNNEVKTRLLSGGYLRTSTTGAETASSQAANFAHNDGFFNYAGANAGQYSWMWKRAKGYFDVVAYTGNATNPQDVSHSLGVVPEMVWHKKRSATSVWKIWHKNIQSDRDDGGLQFDNQDIWAGAFTYADITGNSGYIRMAQTGSNFNGDGITYVMYLFATLAGVSKVGGVTHSGSSTDVDCGFSAGARFVMLKRTDATGDWYIWDSVNGIIAGNDPYLLLNTSAAQVTNTDYIDPLASGFQISGDFTDGDYIFYAIA